MTLPPPDQQPIRDAIAREESRLLRLEHELTEAQARLLSLKAALAAQSDSTEAATLAAIPDAEPRLLIATGRYIGEGFDDARLDTLFLAMPPREAGDDEALESLDTPAAAE